MSRMDPQDARQGRKGAPVLRVLVIALVLAVLAGIGMAIYGYAMPDQTLPDASQGGGVTAPSTTSPAQGNGAAPQGTGTVAP